MADSKTVRCKVCGGILTGKVGACPYCGEISPVGGFSFSHGEKTETPRHGHFFGKIVVVFAAFILIMGAVSVIFGNIRRDIAAEIPWETRISKEEKALETAEKLTKELPMSREDLVQWLREYEGFSKQTAEFAADGCGADWNAQAVRSAQERMGYEHYSYDNLVKILQEYGKFTEEQAIFGAENCGADWQKEAVEYAVVTLSYSSCSYIGLVDWMVDVGLYPEELAVYAADNCGADWNEQAVKCAEEYLQIELDSREEMHSQLLYEGFTEEQTAFALDALKSNLK